MSLREDMETLGRHIENGTAREYMQGTAPRLPVETLSDIRDTSIPASLDTYRFIKQRGD